MRGEAPRRHEQPVLGARPGDVGQPQLLDRVSCLGLLLELLDGVGGVAAEHGEVHAVTAQCGRQHVGHGHRRRAALARGEAALADPDEEDGVPLQALGTVDGEQLDRVGLAGGRDVEALPELVLGLQPGQERCERHLAVEALELRDGLHEEVEVVTARRGRRGARGGELDVDAGGVDDPADQVEDRLTRCPAQSPQLLGEQREALGGLGAVGEVAGIVERVGERGDLRRVGAVDRGQQLARERLTPVGGGGVGGRGAGQLPGAPPEQRQVAGSDGPAGAGQQRQQVGVGGHVADQREGGHDLRDLGQAQQALEPDDLHRDLVLAEAVEDGGRVPVVTRENADAAPQGLGHRVARGPHLGGEPVELVVPGVVDGEHHVAGAGGVGGNQGPGVGGDGVEVGGEVVGGLEDPAVRAPVDGEGEAAGPAFARREVLVEVEDVGHRGAAPAVDSLVGVTHGRHRVAPTVLGVGPGEQPAEHDRLRDGGVLVFVEQHDLERGALGLTHLGALPREARRQRDLVGEVHQAQLGLQRAIALDEVEQLTAAVDRRDRLLVALEVGLAGLPRHPLLEPGAVCGVVGPQRVGVDQVLAELGVEGQQPGDRVRRGVGEVVDGADVTLDGAPGELVAEGVGDEPRVGLVPDPQAVLGEQVGGIGVVGGDGRLVGLLGLVVDGGASKPPGVEEVCSGQVVADPGGQLRGRLGGEGETEDLVGRDATGGDQPHDPRGHHRGLAGSRTGDDDRRLERRRDRLELLVAEDEVGTHHLAQLLGCGDVGR